MNGRVRRVALALFFSLQVYKVCMYFKKDHQFNKQNMSYVPQEFTIENLF
jgi:hypothetical protein